MRNLKRVLSTIMAVAMMMSLVVFSTSAAFNDQDKIVNTDAVNMNVALNIINGLPDGSFNPEGNVTRAEMAKMICIVLNGGKEPAVSAKSGAATFTDIRGHWAEGYIEYCVAEGIVAGMGDGTFQPNGNVTATQAAKMLLVSLGFDAAFEEFNGANWNVKINVGATQKKLYDDVTMTSVNDPLSRDNAAQMVWNALNALEVHYDYSLTTVDGKLMNIQKRFDLTSTLMESKFDTLDTDDTTGILTEITYNSTKKEYTYTVDDATPGSFTSKVDFTKLFGHNVTVVAKDRSNVYGIHPSDSTVVFEGLIGDIDFAKAEANIPTVEFNDKDHRLSVDADGDVDASFYAFNSTTGPLVDASPAASLLPYFKAVAIDNTDDGKIDRIVYYPVYWGTVSYVHKDYIRVTDGTTPVARYDREDNDIYDGVATDDYILIDVNNVTFGANCGVITELEEQTGKLTALAGDNATLGDTEYNMSQVPFAPNNLRDTFDFLAINNYLVKHDATDSEVDMNDYLLVAGVSGAKNASGGYDAKVYLTDGTTKVVNVKSVDGETDPDVYTVTADTLYKYEVSKGDYELTTFDATSAEEDGFVVGGQGGTIDWSASSSASDANARIADNRIADDAVVFLKNNSGEYSVILGSKLARITGSLDVHAYGAEDNSSNGYRYVTLAFVEGSTLSSSDMNYGFITATVSVRMNDDKETYYVFKMWNGTDVVTMTTVGDPSGDEPAKGDIISYTMDGDEIDDINVLVGEYGAVVAFDNANMQVRAESSDVDTVSNVVDLKIDKDDTTILYISKADLDGDSTGSLKKADKVDVVVDGDKTLFSDEDDWYYANVLYIGVDEGTADLIVIDVSNDILNAR